MRSANGFPYNDDNSPDAHSDSRPGEQGVSERGGLGCDEDRATEFGNVAQAEEFCRQQNLPLALVVVKFKDAVNDVSYPASGRDRRSLKSIPRAGFVSERL